MNTKVAITIEVEMIGVIDEDLMIAEEVVVAKMTVEIGMAPMTEEIRTDRMAKKIGMDPMTEEIGTDLMTEKIGTDPMNEKIGTDPTTHVIAMTRVIDETGMAHTIDDVIIRVRAIDVDHAIDEEGTIEIDAVAIS